MRRTKIVCTIGPSCEKEETLEKMLDAGMNVARLNFSHGTHEEHKIKIDRLRRLAEKKEVPLAIVQDLSGPKIRIGMIQAGSVRLTPGSSFTLTTRDVPGDSNEVTLAYPQLIAGLKPGNRVFLADGMMELAVVKTSKEDAVCEVITGGILSSRKGLNAQGVRFEIPSITEKDLEDLRFGISQGVDWVAASFVRCAEDLRPLKWEMERQGARIPIIAKIEKHEAVGEFDAILESADAIMIARGDLGVEIPLDEVPLVQKNITRKCNDAGKPVITATQMLASMTLNPRPTRAEVTDVANAIFDGTDAVMLSDETASGEYPVEAVRMMAQVAERAESALDWESLLHLRISKQATTVIDAISEGSCEIAHDLNVAAIITATSSGQTPRVVSKNRPRAPILAVTAEPSTYRRLSLSWGVHPILVRAYNTTDEMLQEAVEAALQAGLVRYGDLVVITAGIPVGVPGFTNLIKIHKVGETRFA